MAGYSLSLTSILSEVPAMSMPRTLVAVFISSILLAGISRQDERSVGPNLTRRQRALGTPTVRDERDPSSVGDSLTGHEVGNDGTRLARSRAWASCLSPSSRIAGSSTSERACPS